MHNFQEPYIILHWAKELFTVRGIKPKKDKLYENKFEFDDVV